MGGGWVRARSGKVSYFVRSSGWRRNEEPTGTAGLPEADHLGPSTVKFTMASVALLKVLRTLIKTVLAVVPDTKT